MMNDESEAGKSGRMFRERPMMPDLAALQTVSLAVKGEAGR